MLQYRIVKNSQTSIWILYRITPPQGGTAYSGSPDGGNVQALVDLIPRDQGKFQLEVES